MTRFEISLPAERKKERDDINWLFYAEKDEIERRAFADVARWFVLIVMALLVGCALIPVVMP